MIGEIPRRTKRKEKLCKGGTLFFIIEGAWGLRHQALFDLPRARRRRSCWRDLSGSFEVESVIDGDEFIADVSLRMVGTPEILTKDFGNGHR